MNIASVSRILVLSLLIAACLAACQLPVTTKPKELYCPVPMQNCKPGQWEGIPFDTISTKPNTAGYYLKIEPVYLLNSPRDEWGVSFYSPKEAVQTLSTDSGKQYLQAVRFRSPEIAAVEGDITTSITPGSVGGMSVRSAVAVLSALPDGSLPGDASLYQAEFNDKKLTAITTLGEPVSNHIDWDAQPSLTPDGKVMFFASDRKGGVGGTDIWFTVLRNGTWSSPINCGENINSRCDDLTPFVSQDGKRLLISSAGHETVGGYDIFTAEILPSFGEFIRSGAEKLPANTVLFSPVRNYGMPLNTKFDELFPSSPAGTDTLLYYSSNQPAPTDIAAQQKGKFDIYVLHRLEYMTESRLARKETAKRDKPRGNEPIAADVPRTKTKIDGKVINLATKKPVENADVTVRELPNQEIIDKTKTDKDGNYTVTVPTLTDLEISAQNEDLFYDSHKIRLNPNDTLIKLTQNFSLPDKLFLRINFPSDVFDNPYQFVLDSNGMETNQTYTEALDLLAQNLVNFKDKIKKLILIGHTDDVASDAYNLALGKRRVEFVAAELTKRGVPKAMLETKSSGESQPLVQRTDEDLEVYRKRLRRVELQKIMR